MNPTNDQTRDREIFDGQGDDEDGGNELQSGDSGAIETETADPDNWRPDGDGSPGMSETTGDHAGSGGRTPDDVQRDPTLPQQNDDEGSGEIDLSDNPSETGDFDPNSDEPVI